MVGKSKIEATISESGCFQTKSESFIKHPIRLFFAPRNPSSYTHLIKTNSNIPTNHKRTNLGNKMNGMTTPVFRVSQRCVKQRTNLSQWRCGVNVEGAKERKHFVNTDPQWPPVDSAVVTDTGFSSTCEDLRCWKSRGNKSAVISLKCIVTVKNMQ